MHLKGNMLANCEKAMLPYILHNILPIQLTEVLC